MRFRRGSGSLHEPRSGHAHHRSDDREEGDSLAPHQDSQHQCDPWNEKGRGRGAGRAQASRGDGDHDEGHSRSQCTEGEKCQEGAGTPVRPEKIGQSQR